MAFPSALCCGLDGDDMTRGIIDKPGAGGESAPSSEDQGLHALLVGIDEFRAVERRVCFL